jgi:O-antigen ligase
LQNNKQDSSDNLIEHVTSISNISTDASNMERINRWSCAIQMFLEKPVFGWGPGTYQFQYAPFQLYNDKTIISSNQGDMGNAHSEYLGPLAESGLLGLVFFLLLVFVVLFRAINLYYRIEDPDIKTLLLAIIASLLSYFIHGAFNNFLDTDKASVALWSVIAIVVSIDLFTHQKQLINSNK